MTDYRQLIYKLNKEEILKFQDVFFRLELIASLSKNPKRDIRRKLKQERQNSKGKLRKLYIIMLNGDNLIEGIHTHSDDLIKHTKSENLTKLINKVGAVPIILDCEFFPSKEYVEHSFGNKLCEHESNKNKICSMAECPKLHEI